MKGKVKSSNEKKSAEYSCGCKGLQLKVIQSKFYPTGRLENRCTLPNTNANTNTNKIKIQI